VSETRIFLAPVSTDVMQWQRSALGSSRTTYDYIPLNWISQGTLLPPGCLTVTDRDMQPGVTGSFFIALILKGVGLHPWTPSTSQILSKTAHIELGEADKTIYRNVKHDVTSLPLWSLGSPFQLGSVSKYNSSHSLQLEEKNKVIKDCLKILLGE